jgi:multimeric flavodoxin WrbA
MPVSVAIAHHSAAGHTARLAGAVAHGAGSLPGTDAALVRVDALDEEAWATLDAADAIVFGAPTHMGAPSAPFTAFAAATQSRWIADRWRDKVAAGFTNSGTISGDKLHTLQTFAILAAQHGMVWVGLDLKAGWSTSDGGPDELNRLGSWLGAMSHSPLDLGPDLAPRDSDLRTAAHLGRRVARIAQELTRGRASGASSAGATGAAGSRDDLARATADAMAGAGT